MITERPIETTTFYDLSSYWEAAHSLGFPSAIWRLPNETTKHFLTSFSEKPQQLKIDLDELPQGFAIAPYDNPSGDKTYFLPADLLVNFETSGKVNVRNYPDEFEPNFQKFNHRIAAEKIRQSTNAEFSIDKQYDLVDEKKQFLASVEKAISSIRKGGLQKVVLSRKKDLLVIEININTIFEKLCEAYPTAFVSVVYLPNLNEIWIGASPEILVSQNNDGLFKTMALAGTQPAYTPDKHQIKESDAAWRQKEIEEQALVSRYIINCFKKVRVREFEEEGPRSVIAGNLIHLKTIFTVDTKAINFPQLTSVMLDLLHPTSAVCGMPKEAATSFIKETENYNRAFYSGYLGPVKIQNETNLFVNLRTMKIQNNRATLFAGCGITADSDPEKEWLETEIKCHTIENILYS